MSEDYRIKFGFVLDFEIDEEKVTVEKLRKAHAACRYLDLDMESFFIEERSYISVHFEAENVLSAIDPKPGEEMSLGTSIVRPTLSELAKTGLFKGTDSENRYFEEKVMEMYALALKRAEEGVLKAFFRDDVERESVKIDNNGK